MAGIQKTQWFGVDVQPTVDGYVMCTLEVPKKDIIQYWVNWREMSPL